MRDYPIIHILDDDTLDQVAGGSRIYSPSNNSNTSLQLALAGLNSSVQSAAAGNTNQNQSLLTALPFILMARRNCPNC